MHNDVLTRLPARLWRRRLAVQVGRYLCLRFKQHLAMSPARLEARMDSLDISAMTTLQPTGLLPAG